MRWILGGALCAAMFGCVDDVDPIDADIPVPGKPTPVSPALCPSCDHDDAFVLPPVEPSTIALQNRITYSPVEAENDMESLPDVCSVLPPTGPCSVACDVALLEEYIPDGTCVVFRCELTDGRELLAGGCNPS